MAIAKKVDKQPSTKIEDNIEEVISRGGKTIAESTQASDRELKFTLRIPESIMAGVDHFRHQEVGFMSRNTWILKAIQQQFSKK